MEICFTFDKIRPNPWPTLTSININIFWTPLKRQVSLLVALHHHHSHRSPLAHSFLGRHEYLDCWFDSFLNSFYLCRSNLKILEFGDNKTWYIYLIHGMGWISIYFLQPLALIGPGGCVFYAGGRDSKIYIGASNVKSYYGLWNTTYLLV